MDFGNFGDVPISEANAAGLNGMSQLPRQPSIYSLTFDEFQNTWGGLGKDFGSMNMDELLKNIWNAEETHAMASQGGGAGEGGSNGTGNLQRQGSLTLPRTISQKTVDEVWKDLFKESEGPLDGTKAEAVSSMPQRQRTLGEMTLEEFLFRAGIVREDAQTQQIGRIGNGGFYGDLSGVGNNINNNNAALPLQFQQQVQGTSLLPATMQAPNVTLNVPGFQSSRPQQQPLFPKPATVAFAPPINIPNTSQMVTLPVNSVVGKIEQPASNSLIHVSGIPNGGLNVALPIGKGSPASSQMSPAVSKNTLDSSPVSPFPYAFSRGRKPNGALEKVVERRQRRMIKNRESAARSRARKQAYTLELEAEVAQLKEQNEELQKKQTKILEMQKNQEIQQTHNGNWGNKRLCLRRTLTGPW